MAQLSVDKSVKRFHEYTKSMFPWMEAAQKQENAHYRERLLKEIGRGPLRISPMTQSAPTSRLVHRREAKDTQTLTKEDIERRNRVYNKLGKGFLK